MNTNKSMIKKNLLFQCLLVLIFIFAVFPFCLKAAILSAPPQIYHVVIDYALDNYTVNEVTLVNGTAPDRNYQPASGFRFDVVSVNDEILDSFIFEVPNVICSDSLMGAEGATSEGCQQKEQGTFSIEVPYYPTGRNINIYDATGKMVAYADIESYARLCGDNVCQENENRGTCPNDCKSGINDGYCDGAADGTCDSDCDQKSDPDCKQPVNYLYIAAAILALMLAGFAGYFIVKKIRESKDEEQA